MRRKITPALLFCAFFLLLVPAMSAQDWVGFSDSSWRIDTDDGAPDPVGVTDTFEKDLAVADVDRDGDDDMIVVRKVRFSTAGGKANAFFRNENGRMVDRTAELIPDFLDSTDDRDVVLVDINGDSWLDLITATTFADQPRVYMNLGTAGGIWQGFDYEAADNRIPPFTPAPQFCAVAAGDIDNDNDIDLFFVDYSNNLEDRLLINNGSGFFTDETDTRMPAALSQSAFGTDAQIVDMNDDGALDIVKISTLSDSPNSIRILYNNGGVAVGTFTDLDHVYTNSPYMMEVADFNNDDRPDIYAVDDGQDRFLLNAGNDGSGQATFNTFAVTSSPNTQSLGGNTFTYDLDGDGWRDVLVADIDTDIPGCGRNMTALRNEGGSLNVSLYDPLNGANRSWLTQGTFDMAVLFVNADRYPDIWSGTCTGNRIFLNANMFFSGFESGDVSDWN